jgi:16S rRNA G527 N7-methylase RsmG
VARRKNLRHFLELLLQWNRRVSNLISKNDESRIVEAHLAPSIEPAEWIASHGLSSWLDFGSGGGFPALPLALCGVGERWDLVESRRTKTLFLRRAVEQLELGGVRVITDRLENLVGDAADDAGVSSAAGGDDSEWAPEAGDSEHGATEIAERLSAPYDGFTSRATMALGPTLLLAAPIVRPGGFAFLWKGSKLDAELAEAPNIGSDWDVVERRRLSNDMTEVVKLLRRG